MHGQDMRELCLCLPSTALTWSALFLGACGASCPMLCLVGDVALVATNILPASRPPLPCYFQLNSNFDMKAVSM